jgi:iron complex transport system ATP-binding protein
MASPNPIISVQDVRFGYDVAPVVDRVTANLQPGKVTALIGPNAAGKTTLMRLMLGLVRPWSGTVAMGERSVVDWGPAERARRLSYVPQRPGVRFAFTVRQVIAMGAHRLSRRRVDSLVDGAIDRAELADVADRVLMELSGGQQQRVMLARAEVQSAAGGEAMLLDEPGSHLDLQHRHAMMHRLRDLAAGGLAVLVVLHELDLALRYADEAWLMDAGKIVAAGAWAQVITPQRLSRVYGLDLELIDRGHNRPFLVVSDRSGDRIGCDSRASPTAD